MIDGKMIDRCSRRPARAILAQWVV